jgi:hypothetical protein
LELSKDLQNMKQTFDELNGDREKLVAGCEDKMNIVLQYFGIVDFDELDARVRAAKSSRV